MHNSLNYKHMDYLAAGCAVTFPTSIPSSAFADARWRGRKARGGHRPTEDRRDHATAGALKSVVDAAKRQLAQLK